MICESAECAYRIFGMVFVFDWFSSERRSPIPEAQWERVRKCHARRAYEDFGTAENKVRKLAVSTAGKVQKRSSTLSEIPQPSSFSTCMRNASSIQFLCPIVPDNLFRTSPPPLPTITFRYAKARNTLLDQVRGPKDVRLCMSTLHMNVASSPSHQPP